MIGLVAEDVETIVASCGWNPATLPGSHSVALRLKGDKQIVVASDAANHPRFAQHPFVTSPPHIRFLAAVPLRDEGTDTLVGALWLADRAPRTLSTEVIDQLRWFGRLVAAMLDARRDTDALLTESNDRFREFFDRTDDLIMSIDASGRLIHVNEPALVALGRGRRELAGMALGELADPAIRSELEAAVQEVIDTGAARVIETVFVASDGRRITVEGSLQPKLIDERAVLARVIFRDISDRKEFEAELGRARDAALEGTRLKTQFLTNVTHEIRTPMNGVIGMLDLLLATQLGTEQRDLAHQARAAAEQLLAIVNNMLHVSAVQAGSLTSVNVDFDLPKMLERIVEVMRIGALGRDLEIALVYDEKVPAVLRGQQAKVRQVVTNLMDNAVRFTSQGFVNLRVSLQTETETHRVVRFEVTDTGIGISAEDRLLLFEKFSQVEAWSTRRYSGVGLGLATARHLVETMGGLIDVESIPRTGSTFWFTIPFEKASATARADFAGRRAVLVDSNPSSARLLAHYLDAWTMTVDAAATAEEAVESARGADVVLFDDLALAPRLGDAARVFIAPDGRVNEERLRDAGVRAYVARPIGQSELFDALTIAFAKGVRTSRPHDERADETSALPVSPELRARVRILLVEDNFLNMKLTMSQLEKLGYAADSVANGKEAVEVLQERDYGVILMDCQMPIMDGYDATMEIRKRDGRARRRRIIALTANALAGEREKCFAAGMDDYLSKPTRIDELEMALARAVASTS